MAVPAGGSPTVRRILLGSQLRRLREDKHISREDAGYHIRASESKISRLELGRVGFKERDVNDLLVLYGVTDETERDALLALAREANQQGWWQSYSDVLPSWFHPYIGLEESASQIRTYELQFIPGLLQTEDYARAVITRGALGAPKEVIDSRVNVRMNRQRVLARENPLRLWVVLDEAALRRPIGGDRIMHAQINHLLELISSPFLTLQVMPFAFGGHTAEGGAFSILRFPDPDMADIVYLEQLFGAAYLDKREEVDRYTIAMDRLCLDSSTPDRTADVLRKIDRSL
ncbi:helix-turn-helix domain-containing protein [Frankia sp. AgB1.9]|uniref:helix-turn-helix domain-containing protein n=1 Tax=unclassified Frankia TaxID=2632575 RepID=UPI0019336D90|nr:MULTISPECIES: helix-turn-helix transcriptional regulator [unclassified Frankia]MBL7494436.1 helix-turn-helix domain-containing protein [Frankia sp. AgW1.1]MBL7547807.1 helix-turn-helix domain-containing protein [Frankia sp. AgB1.9]MBL7621731.1 helix-turn-helix domain-containing protein [Frankia sp. AgB1.8]